MLMLTPLSALFFLWLILCFACDSIVGITPRNDIRVNPAKKRGSLLVFCYLMRSNGGSDWEMVECTTIVGIADE